MSAYSKLTDEILKMLDEGVVPWRKPWTSELPVNGVTKRSYSGFNSVWLAIRSYGSPFWAGLRQWNKIKCRVRKGERGASIFIPIFKKRTDKATGDETSSLVAFRMGRVFNAEQVTGKNVPTVERREHTPIADAERIIADMPNRPAMHTDSVMAFYRSSTDTVHVPALGQFSKPEGYYATVFHELAHSTGHKSRLDREGIGVDRSVGAYSQEELIAEFTAAMVCGTVGIAPAVIENTVSYIAGWRKRLADGKVSVLAAAGAGQRAADYIRNKVPEPKPELATV